MNMSLNTLRPRHAMVTIDRASVRVLFAALLSLWLFSTAAVYGADVIIPFGNKVTVFPGEVLRLSAKGIAGASIDAKVTQGKAILTTAKIVHRNGLIPMIGMTEIEIEVKPDGKGIVKIKVTVASGLGEAKAKETEYEIDFQ